MPDETFAFGNLPASTTVSDLDVASAAMLAIMAEVLKSKPVPGTRGERPCPACGKRFVYVVGRPRRGAMNMRGACETPDCIQFMT